MNNIIHTPSARHRLRTLGRGVLCLAVAALMAAGCSRPKDRFVLKGSIDNIQQGEFYVYCDDGTFDGVDTIRIDGGSFSYERQLTSPTILTLLYPNFSQTYVVAEPGKTVKMTGEAAKLGEADISGTPENEQLTAFRQEHATAPEAKARLAATEFIRSHKTMLAAVAVFKKYFAYAEAPDPATTISLLNDLKKAQPRNADLAMMDNRLRPILGTSAGQQLPDFSFTTMDGRKVTKADLAGRPLVVAFWATWNNDCNDLFSALTRIRDSYRGRVNLLSVSLDTEKNRCRQRMKRDSITEPVVCDGKGLESPAARQLGLRYIPGNLLVGADGKIVARDLTPKELEKRLEELVD